MKYAFEVVMLVEGKTREEAAALAAAVIGVLETGEGVELNLILDTADREALRAREEAVRAGFDTVLLRELAAGGPVGLDPRIQAGLLNPEQAARFVEIAREPHVLVPETPKVDSREQVTLEIVVTQEEDGNWIAEVDGLAVSTGGAGDEHDNPEDAALAAKIMALKRIAEKLSEGTWVPTLSVIAFTVRENHL